MARSRYEPSGIVGPQVVETGRIARDAPTGNEANGTDGRVRMPRVPAGQIVQAPIPQFSSSQSLMPV
jgi:hypothetical protein